MDHEFSQIRSVLDGILDNHNTERAVPVFVPGHSYIEVDTLVWFELVHQAKAARESLDRVRVALNEAQQLQLF